MLLRQQKVSGFFLNALTVCAAILFIIFSSYRSTASIELSKEKKAGFSSLIRLTHDASLHNSPVTVPSPAVSAKKGHSTRTSFTSKFIPIVPQVLPVGRNAFCLTGKTTLNVPPMRLHLALCVMRI